MGDKYESGPAASKAGWSAKVGMALSDPTRNSDIQATADYLVTAPGVVRSFVPSGYTIKPGERVLLGVNSFYDSAVVDAMVQAIVKVGARVDVICIDMGPDRELEEIDELRGFMHNWPSIPEQNEIRGWGATARWSEGVAEQQKYDQLIRGVGQPPVQTSYRSDTIPWTSGEIFASAKFPREIWDAIEASAWDLIWNKGRGGKVRITDPEGTDVSFTLYDDYYSIERYKETESHPFFSEKPAFGHLFAHPTPPFYSGKTDATGVIAGTTNHFSCPYPTIYAHIEGNMVVSIEGGGRYGDAWREILKSTKDIQYPLYPGKGMFWLWEIGIGTNPKMTRPSNAFMLSGCGTTFERLRSGVLHFGIGTMPMSQSEKWAQREGKPYGHLHIHNLNCTYEITCTDGTKLKLIENGHMTALDDPKVISVASKYGDPAVLLKEVWRAPIPGITAPGSYMQDYSPNPLAWLKSFAGQ